MKNQSLYIWWFAITTPVGGNDTPFFWVYVSYDDLSLNERIIVVGDEKSEVQNVNRIMNISFVDSSNGNGFIPVILE